MSQATTGGFKMDKPTVRQVYAIAHALMDVAGLDWPEDREAASVLLVAVREQRELITSPPVEVPF
jgi:hypothetical protein